jgi:hypothetical protein
VFAGLIMGPVFTGEPSLSPLWMGNV